MPPLVTKTFSHDSCNIFLDSVEFTLKGPGSPVIDLSGKKDSLLVYVLNFFEILAERCGSVVVMERDYMIRKVRV